MTTSPPSRRKWVIWRSRRAPRPGGRPLRLPGVLPRGTAAVLRVGRGPLPVRIDRHRGRAGHPVLDLARPASRVSRVSAWSRGYASLGMLGKDGHEMPIGFSKVTIGFPRVGINCAMCHTASVRAQPGDPPTIIAAGPSHQTAEQQYLRFLFACASDPRFTADTLLGEDCQELSIVSDGPAALSVRDHSPHAPAGCSICRIETPGCATGRTGDAAASIRSIPSSSPCSSNRSTSTIGNSDMVPLWNLKRHGATRTIGTA